MIFGAFVFAQLSFGVGLSANEESLLASIEVLVEAVPSLNSAVLKGSTERETQEPWLADVGDSVDSRKLQRSLLFRLPA